MPLISHRDPHSRAVGAKIEFVKGHLEDSESSRKVGILPLWTNCDHARLLSWFPTFE